MTNPYKGLPAGYGICRTIRSAKAIIKPMVKRSVIGEDQFIDIYHDRLLKAKVFNHYACHLSFAAFFKVIDLKWFMRRFAFESVAEIKRIAKFETTLLHGQTAYILICNNRKYLIQ
jgi:hypothetical protein